MFCSVCTAAFHDDIKAQFGQIVEMLKHSEMSIRSVGVRVLGKLAELREWWMDIVYSLFTHSTQLHSTSMSRFDFHSLWRC